MVNTIQPRRNSFKVATMMMIAVVVPLCSFADEDTLPKGISVKDSLLEQQKFVENKAKNKDKFTSILLYERDGNYLAADGESGQTLREGKLAQEIIEWAMTMADAAVLQNGLFQVDTTIHIPRSDVALIIGKKATLQPTPGAKMSVTSSWHSNYPALIRITHRDNVKLINLGKLVCKNHHAFILDGRNGGKVGIDGGLIFSAGILENKEAWLVDSAHIDIPLIWGEGHSTALVAMEGCEDCRFGTFAALGGRKSGEGLDLNSYNERTTIDRFIGTFSREEVIDMNNSPETIIHDAIIYGKHPSKLIDWIQYPRTGRRLSQKPYISDSSGSEMKKKTVVQKEVKEWRKTVETPGFPENLPAMNIHVTLVAVFADDSEEQVLDKSYKFDLRQTHNE